MYEDNYEIDDNYITHTGNLHTVGKTKRPDSFAAEHDFEPEQIDQATLLAPGGDELILDHPTQYNPYRYCYRVIIDELNIELLVKFVLIAENPEERAPINFTDPKTGETYEIPFFLTPQQGTDPAENHRAYDDPERNRNNFYRNGEKILWTIPHVVRAKHLGGPSPDGSDREPVLLTNDMIANPKSPCHITPERLAEALEVFRDEVDRDPRAPSPLKNALNECLGHRDGSPEQWGEINPDESWGDGDDEDW